MHVVMLIFQLGGAIILLFNSINGRQERIIQNCFPGSNIASRDQDNNCTIDKTDLQKSAMKLYPNIIAFADLVIGYGIAAINPQPRDSGLIRIMVVIVGSVLLAIVEYQLCMVMARKKYAKDLLIPYSELETIGVDTVMTEDEVEKMFED